MILINSYQKGSKAFFVSQDLFFKLSDVEMLKNPCYIAAARAAKITNNGDCEFRKQQVIVFG